jgi:hypothetical protein
MAIISFTVLSNTSHIETPRECISNTKRIAVDMSGTLNSSSNHLHNRSVDFDQDRALGKTFASPLKASYEDSEPTLPLDVIDLHCSNELRPKFIEDISFIFCASQKEILESVGESSPFCKFVRKRL